MRLMVVDDNLLVREGMLALLSAHGHDVVATAQRSETVPALVRSHLPDVVLLDIKLPPTFTDEGLRLAARIRARHREVGVLVLSQYLVTSYAALLLDRSPERVGYLLKDNVLNPEVIEGAIRQVADGGSFIDPHLIAILVDADSSLEVLSDRERETLRLMAEGLSDRGIAERLHVSPHTVNTHVQHIFTKLDLPGTPTEPQGPRPGDLPRQQPPGQPPRHTED